jgi:hypothetical protein
MSDKTHTNHLNTLHNHTNDDMVRLNIFKIIMTIARRKNKKYQDARTRGHRSKRKSNLIPTREEGRKEDKENLSVQSNNNFDHKSEKRLCNIQTTNQSQQV